VCRCGLQSVSVSSFSLLLALSLLVTLWVAFQTL
jgi:hypothetical protein